MCISDAVMLFGESCLRHCCSDFPKFTEKKTTGEIAVGNRNVDYVMNI